MAFLAIAGIMMLLVVGVAGFIKGGCGVTLNHQQSLLSLLEGLNGKPCFFPGLMLLNPHQVNI